MNTTDRAQSGRDIHTCQTTRECVLYVCVCHAVGHCHVERPSSVKHTQEPGDI